MRGYYLQVENFITSSYLEFDENNISGSTYPPSTKAQFIASISNAIWLVGIAILFGGSAIFKFVGMEEPALYIKMKENPVTTFACLFLINGVGASQLSTGAFEIKLNDIVIYSKLSVGRLPNLNDIIFALESHGYTVPPAMQESFMN